MESNFDTRRVIVENHREEVSINKNKLGVSPKQVQSLQKLFDQFDLQQKGVISIIEVIYSSLTAGYRFFDKEIYSAIAKLQGNSNKTLDYHQFTEIIVKTGLSNNELLQIKRSDAIPKISENSDYLDFSQFDFRCLGIPNKKIEKYRSEFNKLCNKKDGRQVYQEFRNLLLTNFKDIIEENEANMMLKEMDYKEQQSLTFENILCALTTKKGLLVICNMMRIIKEMINHQGHINGTSLSVKEYIKPSAFINEFIDEQMFYDLIECYELLDFEGSGVLGKSMINQSFKVLKKQLTAKEKQVSSYFQKLGDDVILFRDFYNLFSGPLKRRNFGIHDIKEVVHKLSKSIEYWMQQGDNSSLSQYNGKEKTEASIEKKTKQVSIKLQPVETKLPSDELDIPTLRFRSMSQIDTDLRLRMDFETEDFEEPQNQQHHEEFSKIKEVLHIQNERNFAEEIKLLLAKEGEEKKAIKILMQENSTLNKLLILKERQISDMKKEFNQVKLRFDGEINRKVKLIAKLKEEIENKQKSICKSREEIQALESKIVELNTRVQRINHYTTRTKAKLADQAKDLLKQKQVIEDLEKKNASLKLEIDELQQDKSKQEKKSKDTVATLNTRIKFLTEKFTEYLTENTEMQSAVHEHEIALRKKENELKIEKDNNRLLKNKISLLEQQLAQLRETEKIARQSSRDKTVEENVLNLEEEAMINYDQNEQSNSLNELLENLKQELINARNVTSTEDKKLQEKYIQATEEITTLKKLVATSESEIQNLKGIISSLESQLADLKRENSEFSSKVKMFSEENTKITLEKNTILQRLNEYKQELEYVHDMIQQGSSPHQLLIEDNLDVHQLKFISEESLGEVEKKLIQKPKEDLKIVKNYINKLELLESKIADLENQLEEKNSKIALLTLNPQEASLETTKKNILELYKKILEAKSIEASELRARIKEKSDIINTNLEIISKLDRALQEKIDELSEITEFKEKVLIENNQLSNLVQIKTYEIEKLLTENNQIKMELELIRRDGSPKKTPSNPAFSESFASEALKYFQGPIMNAIEEYKSKLERAFSNKIQELENKISSLRKKQEEFLSFRREMNQIKSSYELLKLKYDDQKNVIIHLEKMVKDEKSKTKYEVEKQRTYFEKIIANLKEENDLLKKGMISDL